MRNDDELDRWRRNRQSEPPSRWRQKTALEPEPPRAVSTSAWRLGFEILRYTGSDGSTANEADDLFLLLDGQLACGLAHAGPSMPELHELHELPDLIDLEIALEVYWEPLPAPPHGVPWITR